MPRWTRSESEDCVEFSIEEIRAHLAGAPAPEVAPVEWLNTRRGLIGLSRVGTVCPDGSELATWIWFTETGDTGMVDGASGRAMAITDAYVSMVRAGAQLATSGEVQ